jgi:hypothetical protein
MASHVKEQKYSPLKTESVDIEDDSDSTLTSTDGLRRRIKRGRRHFQQSNIHNALTWFRWIIVIILQSVILVLLWQNVKAKPEPRWSTIDTETGGDINGLYIPSKYIFES